MMSILDFYNENYGGDTKIPAAAFSLWERRALTELMDLTSGRIAEKDDDNTKMCICEMAELMYDYCQSRGIESENNDGYSVRYKKRDIKQELFKIANTYLGKTGYLYRGVDNEG